MFSAFCNGFKTDVVGLSFSQIRWEISGSFATCELTTQKFKGKFPLRPAKIATHSSSFASSKDES